MCLCLRLPPSSQLSARICSRDFPRTHPTLPIRDTPRFPNNWCGCRGEAQLNIFPAFASSVLRAAHVGEQSTVRRWLRAFYVLAVPFLDPSGFQASESQTFMDSSSPVRACMTPSFSECGHSSMPKCTHNHMDSRLPPTQICDLCDWLTLLLLCRVVELLSIALTRHPDRGLFTTFWVNLLKDLISGSTLASIAARVARRTHRATRRAKPDDSCREIPGEFLGHLTCLPNSSRAFVVLFVLGEMVWTR
ncbi:hypothetical protein LXA43DRAFT_346140 [Ganoderma leucocontextum]|nr:hypothetical protein LXA43DRAFT_346140 [Ganoderma leucocontextum]